MICCEPGTSTIDRIAHRHRRLARLIRQVTHHRLVQLGPGSCLQLLQQPGRQTLARPARCSAGPGPGSHRWSRRNRPCAVGSRRGRSASTDHGAGRQRIDPPLTGMLAEGVGEHLVVAGPRSLERRAEHPGGIDGADSSAGDVTTALVSLENTGSPGIVSSRMTVVSSCHLREAVLLRYCRACECPPSAASSACTNSRIRSPGAAPGVGPVSGSATWESSAFGTVRTTWGEELVGMVVQPASSPNAARPRTSRLTMTPPIRHSARAAAVIRSPYRRPCGAT